MGAMELESSRNDFEVGEKDSEDCSSRETKAERSTEPDCYTVEDIIESIGGFGRYQKWLTLILILPQLPFAMIVLSPVFTGANKSHNETSSYQNDSTSIFAYSSIVDEWDLSNSSTSWIVDIITSLQMCGMTSGAILSSIFSDQFGRRRCYIVQSLLMFFFGILPAFAPNPWTYACARFLAGFGIGATFVVYLSHLLEFVPPKYRTLCGGGLSLFPIGEMLLALVGFLIPSWRLLTLITAIPALLLWIPIPMIYESPRWLLIRFPKEPDSAHKVFEKVAIFNRAQIPPINKIRLVQKAILKEESTKVHGWSAFKLLIKSPQHLIHMLILTLSNITCAIVYYGISFNAKNLSGSPYLNMFYFGIFDLVASPASILLNNKIGRKRTFMLFVGSGTIFILSLLVIDAVHGIAMTSQSVVTTLSLLGRFGIVAAWGALTCMILETAPTNLRSTCLGFTATAGYLGTILAPQLFALQRVSASVPYAVMAVLTTSSCISSSFIKETTGMPLIDTTVTKTRSNPSDPEIHH